MSATSDTGKKSEEASPVAAPRRTFMDQLRFLKPYWVSDQKWKARLMLGGIIGLTVTEIALTGGIAFGFRAALNALVTKQAFEFAVSGAVTLAGMGAAALSACGRDYMVFALGNKWRGWLNQQFTNAWLGSKTYLRLQHNKRDAHEPDQRIGETILNVATQTMQTGLGLFRAAVGLVTFSALLWQISPFMVGAAVVCAAAAHVATHMIGKSTSGSWKAILNVEAKFRHALVRIRDNAKSIALAGIEPVEKETMRDEFNNIDKARRAFYKVNFRTSLIGTLNGSSATIVPIVLAAPKFFAGTATLGGLELTRQVYGQFYNAINWFPSGYSAIMGWSANVNQLMDFQRDLGENKADITGQAPAEGRKLQNNIVLRHEEGSDKVVLKDLVMQDVDGKTLVDFGCVTLVPGDKMMLSGPAGCGKSAGLSAMRNSWLLGGSGEINLPPEIRFVPQEEYFPDRTLRGIVCSPDPVSRFTREDVVQALTDAGLGDFVEFMDDTSKRGEAWKNTLSGGQKNKLSFAGIFLHAPDVKLLIVDEITAALDVKSEKELYPKMLDRMKHGIVISVAHHDMIAPMHNISAKVANGKVSYITTPPIVPEAPLPVVPPPANSNNAQAPSLRPPKVG